MSKFSSYFALTLSEAILSPLGQVVKLHQWHCALIFVTHKQIFFILLEYLCPHASSFRVFNLPQLIHIQFHEISVSLSFAFSCIISIANSTRFRLFFFFLYSLSGFHSNFLISFLHLRSYSTLFLFI